jgi:hypothetical protein
MALFVHLASDKDRDSIRRSGIKTRRVRRALSDGYERVVFAMPVTKDFYVSHQWLRELKRAGQRTIVGVYFRIPDGETVLVGHYNQAHSEMAANEAVGVVFNSGQTEGFEVVIPRKIEPEEIHRVKTLPQVLGWRYYPEAKGRNPCGCPYCTKGDIKSKRIRDAYDRSLDD